MTSEAVITVRSRWLIFQHFNSGDVKGTITGTVRYHFVSNDVRRHRLISISYISLLPWVGPNREHLTRPDSQATFFVFRGTGQELSESRTQTVFTGRCYCGMHNLKS